VVRNVHGPHRFVFERVEEDASSSIFLESPWLPVHSQAVRAVNPVGIPAEDLVPAIRGTREARKVLARKGAIAAAPAVAVAAAAAAEQAADHAASKAAKPARAGIAPAHALANPSNVVRMNLAA
jgi:hypothetical protein